MSLWWYTCSTRSSRPPTHASQHLISAAFDSVDLGMKPKERYCCARGFKPDGVGIIGDLPIGMKDSELSWEDIEVIVESKRTVRKMVQQSGMYTVFVA